MKKLILKRDTISLKIQTGIRTGEASEQICATLDKFQIIKMQDTIGTIELNLAANMRSADPLPVISPKPLERDSK